jgi:hypothetical protein
MHPVIVAMSLADPSKLIAEFPILDIQLPSPPTNTEESHTGPMQRKVCSPTSTTPHWAPAQPWRAEGTRCHGLPRLQSPRDPFLGANKRAAKQGPELSKRRQDVTVPRKRGALRH